MKPSDGNLELMGYGVTRQHHDLVGERKNLLRNDAGTLDYTCGEWKTGRP